MPTESLPRLFGNYLLTATLGQDALGRQYRALRTAGERGFVRLRILESPELSNDALLDAIEENGEVHGFLKNPAIARGVDMDAVEGLPYIAWNEASGRTLVALREKCRSIARRIPVEHALLIAEKVATALDHAYNTTIDGDRTLHGLVWPGFVAISDDGEIRLAGFGLASGVLPSIGQPLLSREVAPYLAPEERAAATVGDNSDVFSVGAILLELLTGEPPPAEALAALKGAAGAPPPVLPEILAVLRMTLGPPATRYKSSGDLRRELGKLLFSGPYSPSTFNLAYFLNDLFRDEIEAESRARKREASLDASGPAPPVSSPPLPSPERPAPAPAASPVPARPAITGPRIEVGQSRRKNPLALVGVLLAAAAVAGGIYVVSRRSPVAPFAAGEHAPTAAPTPTLLPELQATPSGPTTGMTAAQFRDEVSRRVALEMERLEAEMRARAKPSPVRLSGGPVGRQTAAPAVAAAEPAIAPMSTPPPAVAAAAPPAVAAEPERPAPSPAPPAPTRVATREGALVTFEELDSPPRIAKVVKPAYPPLALKARIGGTVVLRVLVSEQGLPIEVTVFRGAPAGLDGAAVSAVKNWTFTPPTRDGVAVRTWVMVPIPFEP